jgi:serine phosphatase RsbU (regulator of sigma subunit)
MNSGLTTEQISAIYSKLYQIGKNINENNEIEDLYGIACDFATQELNYEKALIFEHNDANGWFHIVKSEGYDHPVEQKILKVINLLLSGAVIEYLRVTGKPIIHTESDPKEEVASLLKSLFMEEAYLELFGGDKEAPFGLIVVGNGFGDKDNFSRLQEGSLSVLALGNFTVQLSNTINNIIFYRAWQDEKATLEEKVKQRTDALVSQKRFVETLLNSQEQMIITTDGLSLRSINDSFKAFFNVSSIYEFQRNYQAKCICDVFNPKAPKSYLKAEMEGQHWIDYLINSESEESAKVLITDQEGMPAIFSVTAANLPGEGRLKSAVFTEITDLEQAKNNIERMHEQTQDSIEYAALIQQAIIPSEAHFEAFFQEFFTYWKPKDIVGGDIYLLDKVHHEESCLLMVIDCTGHGVPGAFVTMLVKAIERQVEALIASNPDVEISPSWILQYFNKTIKKLLKQEDNESLSNVGFDGGIVYYNKRTKRLKFASAGTALYYVEDGVLKTLKGNRQSVGYRRSNTNFTYREHSLKVQEDMLFYLSTDGYIDQNGGSKGLPMGKERFKELILTNHKKPLKSQKETFIRELITYQKDYNRNDDITLVGFKI